MKIGPARRRFGRIHPMLAVDVILLLGLAVIGLEIGIADRPCGRDPAMVPDLAEILLAQAEQRGAVEFGVAADVIMDAGWKARPSLPYQVSCALYFDCTKTAVGSQLSRSRSRKSPRSSNRMRLPLGASR